MSKGNLKCFGIGGRHRLTERKPADGGEWFERVKTAGEKLLLAAGGPLDGPVSLELTFTLPRPKTVSRAARQWPVVKPDLDKYQRLVLDAFTASGLWRDDGQVVEITARKAYPDTPAPDLIPAGGALIRVWRTQT